jgi:prepilin-type N-terminal cleavage/methylation domain-containing protein
MTTHKNQRGYTLIELIVSVAIFSVVMLVAGTAFLSLISLDRKARATNDLVSNLSYVVDSMERSIRTGTLYSSASGASTFSYTDANGRIISYRLTVNGTQGQIEQRIDSGTWSALTDPLIDVENLTFYPSGTALGSTGDKLQPTVTIIIRGKMKPDSQSPEIEFVIESSATQRLIDI